MRRWLVAVCVCMVPWNCGDYGDAERMVCVASVLDVGEARVHVGGSGLSGIETLVEMMAFVTHGGQQELKRGNAFIGGPRGDLYCFLAERPTLTSCALTTTATHAFDFL